MSHNRHWWRMGLVIALLGIAGAAHATVYDISADFSTTTNPKGVWTYGYEKTLGAELIPYDVQVSSGGIDYWHATAPYISGAPVDWNYPTTGTAAFHPGFAGEYSVFRFTTPIAGVYSLFATFGALDSGGTDVHVLLNGSSLYSHEVSPTFTSESFSASPLLAVGNTIDFAVGVGTDGDFRYDSTSISASLTSGPTNNVPEPTSLTLLGSALVSLAFLGRRRRIRSGKPSKSW